MSSTPKSQTDAHREPDPISIVEDLTKRFETLQQWHRDTETGLNERAQALDERETAAQHTEADQKKNASKLTRRREAQKRYRTKLERQARDLDERQRNFYAEEQKLDARRETLDQGHAEVARLREELDEEWSNLTRIRRSQEALAAALETDRKRINQQRFRLGPSAQVELQSERFHSPQAA